MKYRKKPVVIDAMELTRDNIGEVKDWCGARYWSKPPMRAVTGLHIETLEGMMVAQFGDYIIRGVKGEFYPCKPDIFAATYEPAGDVLSAGAVPVVTFPPEMSMAESHGDPRIGDESEGADYCLTCRGEGSVLDIGERQVVDCHACHGTGLRQGTGDV